MVATTARSAGSQPVRFYLWITALCAAFAFLAFSATYWLQLAAGTFKGGTGLLHLHAALFSAWVVLLLSQAWLVSRRSLALHRAWGVAGVSLATAMVLVGLATAHHSVTSYLAQGYGDKARAFYILPFGSVVEFGLFFLAAVLNISRPEWHKRLMIVATAAALQAAAARIGFAMAVGTGPGIRPGLTPPPPVETGAQGAAMVCLLLAAGAVYDWRTRGRPHPAWLIGLAVILLVGFAGPALTATPAWLGFVDAMMRFG